MTKEFFEAAMERINRFSLHCRYDAVVKTASGAEYDIWCKEFGVNYEAFGDGIMIGHNWEDELAGDIEAFIPYEAIVEISIKDVARNGY